jgi:uncharacterized protein YdiU (UPF0061 family)
MNTDNCAISGETIDYGPCAFMDTFHPDKVFSFIDRNGRYAWGNQPTIAHWNLTRLAETLLPILDPSPERAKELASTALNQFIDHFQPAYLNQFREKLGLSTDADLEASAAFIKSTLGALAQNKVDFTLFFRHLTLLAADDARAGLPALFSDLQAAETWIQQWKTLQKPDDHLTKMKSTNPILIPRNHRIEEAIQAAYQNDFSLFHRLADALAKPFEENPEFADLELAPLPEQCVKNTFCGT